MINNNITDKTTGHSAEVDSSEDEKKAVVVATRPLKIFDNKLAFFLNDTYGIDMNVNGVFGGTQVDIHDGTDNGYWTAADVVGGGKTTFNSTDQNHTTGGAKSIKSDNSPVGDIFEIDKGSNQDLSSYVAVTMWIYVDKDWKDGDQVDFYAWLSTGTPAQIGTKVDLSDYFMYDNYDTWHKITIPLVDMGLTGLTIDTFRVEQEAAEGKAPKYYLDDIRIEETGDPVIFTLEPDKGTWLRVKSFQIVVANVYDSTLVAASMPNLPYDTLLGTALTSGINYKRIEDGVTVSAATINKFVDFMVLSNATITGSGGDGTNTWIAVNIQFNEEVILKPENADKMTLTINDDLSGLLYLRVGVGSKVEDREL